MKKIIEVITLLGGLMIVSSCSNPGSSSDNSATQNSNNTEVQNGGDNGNSNGTTDNPNGGTTDPQNGSGSGTQNTEILNDKIYLTKISNTTFTLNCDYVDAHASHIQINQKYIQIDKLVFVGGSYVTNLTRYVYNDRGKFIVDVYHVTDRPNKVYLEIPEEPSINDVYHGTIVFEE